MEPLTLILTALAAGAAAAAKDTAAQAVKDGYKALKDLILSRWAGRPEAQTALAQHEQKPDVGKGPVADAVTSTGLDKDQLVISTAKALVEVLKAQPGGEQLIQAATGSYIAQAAGGSTATVSVGSVNPSANRGPGS
jgi:hypothetical protein